MKHKIGAAVLAAILLAGSLTGCSGSKAFAETIPSRPDMTRVFYKAQKQDYDKRAMDDKYLDLVFGLGEKVFADEEGNAMISPASLFICMELAAAGTGGQTLDEITEALMPGATNEEVLKYAIDMYKQLDESEQIDAANLIALNDEFKGSVHADYINYMSSDFGAEVSGLDAKTINKWVNEKTNGMIPKIVDGSSIDDSTKAMLVNTLAFNADWAIGYWGNKVVEGETFMNSRGEQEEATMLRDGAHYTYETDKAAGFKRYYKTLKYSFIAILPAENMDANDFLASFTADDYRDLMNSENDGKIMVSIPKFSYDYENNDMRSVFEALGINKAFTDSADFSGIADEELFLSRVVHKTHIDVTASGTSAAAATAAPVTSAGGMIINGELKFDRPFVYMIVDDETMLPVFIGTVNSVA